MRLYCLSIRLAWDANPTDFRKDIIPIRDLARFLRKEEHRTADQFRFVRRLRISTLDRSVRF